MSALTSGSFWKDAGERAVRSAAGFAVSVLTVASVTPADIDWEQVLAGSGLAALVSLLLSISASNVGGPTPSFMTPEQPPAAPADPGPVPGGD